MEPSVDVTPTPAAARGWKRHLTLPNLLLGLLLLWAAPRFLPHIGAVVGVGSGGERVPQWAVTTLDGTPLSSESRRGKVLLVNVWATWCLPCRAEMPLLQAMHERHKSAGFEVIGFSVDATGPDGVRAFLAERGITYPVAIVGEAEQLVFGGVRGIPTSFLVDRTGKVRHAVIGPLAAASLEPAVRRLLNEPAVAAAP